MKKYSCSFLIIIFLASCNILNAANFNRSKGINGTNSCVIEPKKRVENIDVSYQEIRVTNIKEFIRALGSNRIILVESGNEFIFTDSDILGDKEAKKKLSKLDTLSKYYDETYIHDIKNLTIKGIGDEPPSFLQPDGYNHVLKFRNVENIKIENIRMGHSPEVGHCMGGVILFENCKNIILNKLELFGSGTEGLSLLIVENFTIKNSLITKCTEQLSTFSHVKNAIISNCRFIENETSLRGFAIYKSTIKFINSQIKEKYPFYLDCSKDEGYLDSYDILFYVDKRDLGSIWYQNSSNKLNSTISASAIIFENTIINGELINGEMLTPELIRLKAQKKVEEKYEDGQIKETGNTDKAGNKTGEWKYYYPDGQITMTGNYENDKPTGEWKYYNKKGKFQGIQNFENGEQNGEWKAFYENGALAAIGNYKNGQETGIRITYYDNGKLREISNYKNGQLTGEFRAYYKNGELIAIGNYEYGKKTGEWKEYYENGALKIIGSFKYGKKTGEWKFFDDNGSLEKIENN